MSDGLVFLAWTLPLAASLSTLALLRQTYYSQLQPNGEPPPVPALGGVAARAAIMATHLQSIGRHVRQCPGLSRDDLRVAYILASLEHSYIYGIWLYGILPAFVTKFGSALAVRLLSRCQSLL
jgi:hypothetical protein